MKGRQIMKNKVPTIIAVFLNEIVQFYNIKINLIL